jgi:hypothetical protein
MTLLEEVPSSKFQVPEKLQATSTQIRQLLELGTGDFFGAWSLEFSLTSGLAQEHAIYLQFPRGHPSKEGCFKAGEPYVDAIEILKLLLCQNPS